jgi:hypothetical protein
VITGADPHGLSFLIVESLKQESLQDAFASNTPSCSFRSPSRVLLQFFFLCLVCVVPELHRFTSDLMVSEPSLYVFLFLPPRMYLGIIRAAAHLALFLVSNSEMRFWDQFPFEAK